MFACRSRASRCASRTNDCRSASVCAWSSRSTFNATFSFACLPSGTTHDQTYAWQPLPTGASDIDWRPVTSKDGITKPSSSMLFGSGRVVTAVAALSITSTRPPRIVVSSSNSMAPELAVEMRMERRRLLIQAGVDSLDLLKNESRVDDVRIVRKLMLRTLLAKEPMPGPRREARDPPVDVDLTGGSFELSVDRVEPPCVPPAVVVLEPPLRCEYEFRLAVAVRLLLSPRTPSPRSPSPRTSSELIVVRGGLAPEPAEALDSCSFILGIAAGAIFAAAPRFARVRSERFRGYGGASGRLRISLWRAPAWADTKTGLSQLALPSDATRATRECESGRGPAR
mmetsp:Transcript_28632/g.88545  ORF Transcript_28632/g.88545 Transcript_28632/m.88545 type:complete len:340 (+) Transcript_28632:758-1777(+)